MAVYWITGLSGAGKTTLCEAFVKQYTKPIVMFDGDILREVMGATQVHRREERLELAMKYAKFCQMIAHQGIDVAIATISLFQEVHEWNRLNLPGYLEIFLDVPVEELRRRNSKKIYTGQNNIAGVDFNVDFPKNPDVHIKWTKDMTVEKALKEINDVINKS